MPNRIIKQSAFESEKISALSDFDFRLWVGLITQADDAGRGDARPAILKGHIFPLRERVTAKDIEAALLRLAAGSCISLYNVGGKSYYQFPNWAKHQRVYNVKSKVPGPEEAEEDDFANLPQSAASCGELPQTAASCRLNPNPNPNINPNPNPNPKESARTRAKESAESVFSQFVSEFCDGDEALLDALNAFAGMRKQIKKPLSAHAACLIVKRLEEFPRETWGQIIDQSVLNCWQGLYPLDRNGTVNVSQTGKKIAGVSKRAAQTNAQCQRHNEVSPGMAEAARRMLEGDT